jgi:predicted Rossmann-fold nucleotide-binding protein
MPGGIGTREEMMEVWTMNQLSEIDNAVRQIADMGRTRSQTSLHEYRPT